MIYAWKVLGWFDGHPAGHVGTYRTREDADVAARRTRVTTRIKRVRVPDDYFDPPTDDDDARVSWTSAASCSRARRRSPSFAPLPRQSTQTAETPRKEGSVV